MSLTDSDEQIFFVVPVQDSTLIFGCVSCLRQVRARCVTVRRLIGVILAACVNGQRNHLGAFGYAFLIVSDMGPMCRAVSIDTDYRVPAMKSEDVSDAPVS